METRPRLRSFTLTIASLLVMGSALCLAPPAATAQWENRIGIFTDASSLVSQVMANPAVPFEIHFVLLSPRDADGVPVATCDGFDYEVTIAGPPGLFRLADTTPPGWSSLGDASDPYHATYRLQGPTPLPVVKDVVDLQAWTVMVLTTASLDFYLGPPANPTVPDRLSYSYPGPGGSVTVGALNTSGYFAFPVFCVNCFMIDRVERQTYGSIKALYR